MIRESGMNICKTRLEANIDINSALPISNIINHVIPLTTCPTPRQRRQSLFLGIRQYANRTLLLHSSSPCTRSKNQEFIIPPLPRHDLNSAKVLINSMRKWKVDWLYILRTSSHSHCNDPAVPNPVSYLYHDRQCARAASGKKSPPGPKSDSYYSEIKALAGCTATRGTPAICTSCNSAFVARYSVIQLIPLVDNGNNSGKNYRGNETESDE